MPSWHDSHLVQFTYLLLVLAIVIFGGAAILELRDIL